MGSFVGVCVYSDELMLKQTLFDIFSFMYTINTPTGAPVTNQSDIKKQLQQWLIGAKKVVVAGIGNPIRGDDNVGVKIVEALQGKFSSNVFLIEAETVPEGYMYDIEEFQPTHILLVDAAVLGLEAGQTKLLAHECIPTHSTVSSHTLPLRIFSEYLIKTTGAKIGFLLIEPKNVEFGEDLSPEIQQTADKIISILKELLTI
jgi:hydrogenase 3 maturation protease